ncbi:MAG: hybrid sensor histidine kinase/response regulator [Polyangiaceae bacterium]|nr:hybrid sensor histidine kinase/response regulator [Myxococcales bacterium]MCC6901393.1 hybrid sensor histidine kinase/response regulator [Polyangiaceae bacterium]
MAVAVPKVLHIEDDPANRLLVRKLLTAAGFDVVDARDGLEGIRMAGTERPDLVLVDIAMPGLDGYEVTLRLRSQPELFGVPIVAITAEGSRETSLAVGCDGFLQKPIDARSFATTLRGYLDGRREQVSPDQTGKQLRLQSQKIAAHLEQKVAELESANERLREVDVARKEFYRNISHELATPMTPIVGYVKLLADQELGPLVPAQAKALRAMGECVERLRGLIDNLLDVTALETGKLKLAVRPVDFGEIFRRALGRRSAHFETASLAVATEIPDGLSGQGDPERLGQALDHLLDNALKFTPSGGSVGVRVRRLASGHVEVVVADTGPGVPAETLERLFEPFYQVDGSPTRAHGGTGIGLAIVRGIARGHGGDARVTSPADERIGGVRLGGAAFTVLVPERAPRA